MHQAAAQALGMLEIAEARDDIRSILEGTEKYGDWDIQDAEHVWHLIHALALLGEQDLNARIPDSLTRRKYVVEDVVAFHATGQPPEPSAVEVEKIEKARVKLAKKRRKISGQPSR